MPESGFFIVVSEDRGMDIQYSPSNKKRSQQESKDNFSDSFVSPQTESKYISIRKSSSKFEEIELEQLYDTSKFTIRDELNKVETDLISQYDFCIILPLEEDGQLSKKSQGYINNLRYLKFELYAYKNVQEDQLFVLLRAPLDKLRASADHINMPLLLDPTEIQDQLKYGDERRGIKPVLIPHRPEITKYLPNEFIYGKYSRQIGESLYWRENGASHPFNELTRLKICGVLLEVRPKENCENLKIRRYLRNGWMLGCFPFHNEAKLNALRQALKFYPFSPFPYDRFKDYFGEKIALYFSFVEHYTFWLVGPAIIGLPLQLAIWSTNDYNAPFLPFYAVFIALWSIFMLEVSRPNLRNPNPS
jgi:hypothetical protein